MRTYFHNNINMTINSIHSYCDDGNISHTYICVLSLLYDPDVFSSTLAMTAGPPTQGTSSIPLGLWLQK